MELPPPTPSETDSLVTPADESFSEVRSLRHLASRVREALEECELAMTEAAGGQPEHLAERSSRAVRVVTLEQVRRPEDLEACTSPKAAAALASELIGRKDREHFVALHLDAKHCVRDAEVVSIGTMTSSLVHPREVFKAAIMGNAAAIIVAHNHPSGDTLPSKEDQDVARRLEEAGKLLGIPVLDFVVVGGPPGSRYWSRQEHGHAKQAGLSEGSPVVRESGPTETLEPTYACPNCGGTDIEHLDWVRTNTGELVGGNYGGSESDNYCPSCEEQGNYPHFKWAVEARRVRAAARELLEHFDEELCAHGGEGGPFSKDVAPFAELVGEVARDFVATDELSVEEALSRLLREAIELDEVHYAVAAREFRSALKADLDLLRDHPEYRPIWAELLTPPASKTTKE